MSPHLSQSCLRLTLVATLTISFAACISHISFAGQQPGKKKEEEEDPVKPAKKVPVRVDDDQPATDTKKPGGSAPQVGDLAAAAKDAKQLPIKKLFQQLAVPHDVVSLTAGRDDYVEPISMYIGPKPSFKSYVKVQPFDNKWEHVRSYEIYQERIRGVEHYEQLAQRLVDEFLAQNYDTRPNTSPSYIPRQEVLQAAVDALAAAVRFHESARERGIREGEAWDEIEGGLRTKLFAMEIKQLQAHADHNDWANAYKQAKRLAEAYPRPETQGEIAKTLIAFVEKSIKDNNASEGQLRLRLIEDLFPSAAAPRQINDQLKKEAQRDFDEALRVAGTDQTAALTLLQIAEKKWPNLPGLRDERLKMLNQYPILRVGVPSLPGKDSLSPARAASDADRWAVEMIFDSLLKPAYDAKIGQFYEPGLALATPKYNGQGRLFQLARNAYWSNGQPVTAADIAHTIRLLQDDRWPGRNVSWGDDLVEKAEVGGDPFRVNVLLKQGFLDSQSLLTFKILPQEPVPGQMALTRADDPRFGAQPVGSGPFMYEGRKSDGMRQYDLFKANPYYSGRTRKIGLPRIREIQFFHSDDPITDFKDGKLDLLLDLKTRQVTTLKDALLAKVVVPEPMPNRRVYFLAVNHRQAPLQNADLRRALAYAIDRQEILTKVYRAAGFEKIHKALNGPYPAGSWACASNIPPDLFDVDKAKTWKGRVDAAGVRFGALSLKYPDNDRDVENAMKLLKEQVQKTTNFEIELKRMSPADLRRDVEMTHDYELAYYHFDYASEAYWLWPLFDPRCTGPGGANYMGYAQDSDLESLFRNTMGFRDFHEVAERTHLIHNAIVAQMPLIPLWQLDTHVAYVTGVHPEPFDPLLVFTDIEHWQIKKQ
jgi:peptide/nickel transport system substrate-binding protein